MTCEIPPRRALRGVRRWRDEPRVKVAEEEVADRESQIYIHIGRAHYKHLDAPVLTAGRDLLITVDSWSH